MPQLRPVVLSGGSGTRLWPLSTLQVPKQFSRLFGEKSLFGMTLERMEGLPDLQPSLVVIGTTHLDLVEQELASSPISVGAIVVEPVGRNTAPAAVAAALVAEPDDILVILPSDHLIADKVGFHKAVSTAAAIAVDSGIVTFGIEPARPETGFGYIEIGPAIGSAFSVARFIEKPDLEVAVNLSTDGKHFWNSGIFIARADHLLDEARRHCPGVLDGVTDALPDRTGEVIRLDDGFASVEAIPFDTAIMERTDRAFVIPLDVGWDDLGSYLSLLAASSQDNEGNHFAGDVTHTDVSGSYVRATSRRVVVAGLEDMVVVETPDAVLVLPLDRVQDVKDLQSVPDSE